MACTLCEAGTYSQAEAAACTLCEEGKTSAEGSTSSSDCSSNMLDDVPSIVVSGICAWSSSYNGVYEPLAFTKSGRPWYRNGNGRVLYWDPKCDGGTGGDDRWIFDDKEPSVTAESDLDGEWREAVEERK